MTLAHEESGVTPHETRWDGVGQRTDCMGGSHPIPLRDMQGIMVENEVHVDTSGQDTEKRGTRGSVAV